MSDMPVHSPDSSTPPVPAAVPGPIAAAVQRRSPFGPIDPRTSAELRVEQARTLAASRRSPSFGARALFVAMDLIYGRGRTLEKFRVLELVARVPYQAWENVAYVAMTHTARRPGFARRVFDTVRVNRWEQDNEQWHLMAEYLGIELEDVAVPDAVPSPVSAAHEHLSRSLSSIKVDDPFVAYQVRIAFRLARHLERFNQIGAEVMDADRADIESLTKHRAPANWDECEAELERFVLTDNGRHDRELVALFNRRYRRYKALMGPMGSAMAAHHVMQPFGRAEFG